MKKLKEETLFFDTANIYDDRYRTAKVVRGDQIQDWRSLSELKYSEEPLENFIKILHDKAGGLEEPVFIVEVEPGRWDDGYDLIIGIKGWRTPTDKEVIQIAAARAQAKKVADEQNQRVKDRELAELARLQKKYTTK